MPPSAMKDSSSPRTFSRTGRTRLPPLDVPALRAQEARDVEIILEGIEDPEDLLERAVDVIATCRHVIESLRHTVLDAALSYYTHDTDGGYYNVPAAMGKWGTWLHRVRGRTPASGFAPTSMSVEMWRVTAEALRRAELRQEAAIPWRNLAIVQLVDAGQQLRSARPGRTLHQAIADLTGLDYTRISEIVSAADARDHTADR